jgi:hypothetical protein
MAGRRKEDSEDLIKCGECKKVVANTEKGVQCEMCEIWFHCKCEGVLDDTYKIMKQEKVHFYCGRCDKTVGQLLKTVMDLKARQDRLEEKLKKSQDEVKGTIQDFVSTLTEEAKTKHEEIEKLARSVEDFKKELVKANQYQKKIMEETKSLRDGLESVQKNLEQTKKDTEIKILQELDINKQVEQLTQAFIQDEKWSEIVKKQVDTKFDDVSKDLNSIQKLVVDTKYQAEEEKDKEKRSRNIIIYKLEESNSSNYDVRIKHDRDIVCNIMKELIANDFEENEIVKVFRMGKLIARRTGEECTPRPLLVQFESKMTKNYLMNHLYGLRKSTFKGISISHDMTLDEREQCKKMVQEAKSKESSDSSGEWIYRVRGLPGQMKVVRWRKVVS